MATLWVRRTPASAATVRHTVHFAVVQASLGLESADDAALLISELISNSVRHARALPSGYLIAGWEFDGRGVRVHVTDGGAGADRPRPQSASVDDTTGRGLAIVAALADDWGVHEQAASTTVWAHLLRRAAQPTAPLPAVTGRSPGEPPPTSAGRASRAARPTAWPDPARPG